LQEEQRKEIGRVMALLRAKVSIVSSPWSEAKDFSSALIDPDYHVLDFSKSGDTEA